ncbi:hypothetical protein [Halorubrum sp. N11]|uniref:hypothetical protein n=1 Tax=Halorubrum sp. N11 TaxID=3402276 RepID=UPI003EBEA42E
MKRRGVLLGTTTVFGGLAGCSGLSSVSATVDLDIFNHTESPYTVEFALFESGGDSSRSDARVYDESIDVEPQGRAERENIAEARPYLLRYAVYEDNSKQTDQDHIHYYPPEKPENTDVDTLAFDIDSAGIVTRR